MLKNKSPADYQQKKVKRKVFQALANDTRWKSGSTQRHEEHKK